MRRNQQGETTMEAIKVIRIGGGIKRIINLLTGRDVLISGKRGQWTMVANYNQADAHSVCGTYDSVQACIEAVR
jgi:hypothetical protein